MTDSKQPARPGYGTSSREALNASGYRYPASHFVPPAPLEEASGGILRRSPAAASPDGGTDGGTSLAENPKPPRKANARKGLR